MHYNVLQLTDSFCFSQKFWLGAVIRCNLSLSSVGCSQHKKNKKMLQLTKNLKLTSIDENNVQGDKLLAVVCYFTFFGEVGIAYILTNKLDGDYPYYAMTEISSELSDSFNDLLEDDDNWKKIEVKVKEYIKEWELQNAD